MRNRKRLFWIAPLAMLGIAGLIAICGWIVMYLWNWLLPPLFGWRVITFWQALALLILCRFLFGGGFGGHRSHRFGIRRRWQDRMSERMVHMSAEEREQFRQRMRERCGFPPPPTEAQGN